MAVEILEDEKDSYESQEGTTVEPKEPEVTLDNSIPSEGQNEGPKADIEPDISVPDKYQGKSTTEIIQMHQEAERLAGRQSNEVGELRKLVDDFILTQSNSSASKDAPKDQEDPDSGDSYDDLDFFDNPSQAISKAIESNPLIKQLAGASQESQREKAVRQIQKDVPNIAEVVTDQNFQTWVKRDPERLALLARVDNYDYNAAKSLFGTWNEIQGNALHQVNQAKEDRSSDLRKANTGAVKSSQEATPKKIYRRADIMKLMTEDPDRYDTLQPEIMRAYSEGRVK
jgi:hypothetical protein